MSRVVDSQGRVFGKISLIDLAVVSWLVCLTPLVYYGYGSVKGHLTLSIESIHPSKVTIGVEQQLTVMGNGFDDRSTIQLADFAPRQARFINDARLDLGEIPSDIGPGWQLIRVTNGRGRSIIRNEGVFIVWRPEIASVYPRTIQAGAKTLVTITGRYFETGCTISVGSLSPQWTRYVGPTQLEMHVLPTESMRGKQELRITNPSGGQVLLPEALEVVLPDPLAGEQTSRVPAVLIAFAFPDLDVAQASKLTRGAVATIEFPPQERLRARIVDVVHKMSEMPDGQKKERSPRPPSRQIAFAWVLLTKDKTGETEGLAIPFRPEEPLATPGGQVLFHFDGINLTGITLSVPHASVSRE